MITSPHNPRIKALAALRRRPARERSDVMLVEGYDELRLALESGARLQTLYYSAPLVQHRAQLELLDRLRGSGVELVELSPRAFERVAYRQGADGWLGVFSMISTGLSALQPRANALIIVCESVEKPGNLGAILRTADASDADAVIAASPVTDWGNPNLIRASKGCIFSVPVAEADGEEVIRWLREREIRIVIAAPDAGATLSEADLTGAVAIVLGSESRGLSKEWRENAEVAVRIPMFGHVNSLNVATSAALLVYEALRQRGQLAT